MHQVKKHLEGFHRMHGERYLAIGSESFCVEAYLSTLNENVERAAYESLWEMQNSSLEKRIEQAEKRYKVKMEMSKPDDSNESKVVKICLKISA